MMITFVPSIETVITPGVTNASSTAAVMLVDSVMNSAWKTSLNGCSRPFVKGVIVGAEWCMRWICHSTGTRCSRAWATKYPKSAANAIATVMSTRAGHPLKGVC